MKTRRHNEIFKIIENFNVDRQETLQKYLQHSGFNVTQATVSRDIKELQLVKRLSEDGVYKYALPDTTKPKRGILADIVSTVDYAMNTVVVKCHTGMAQAACAEIDSMSFSEIIGTLAGDDTIFILLKNESEAINFVNKLRNMIAIKR